MTDQTPAETLRTAAERLQWLLHPDGMPERIRRPWLAPADGMQGRITVPDEDVPVAVAMWGGAAEYIAAMHPGVGLALVDWLKREAKSHEAAVVAAAEVFRDDPAAGAAWVARQDNMAALAVAHALLGGVS
ncbi:hypothetical protein [Kitasatospora sp. NBC_01302]|uniref:hypothetical protein n=1 Tax=Kitasatospora sp. NBC_01302 TaxID=2903575 RepID=UPI002E166930|nr:hypothetical protein OG294_13875 [Kitasatospora sp. NBC_01302]